eukprot:COSAG02_NODE_2960_length_7651_cov_6.331435_5_plen_69_part_00
MTIDAFSLRCVPLPQVVSRHATCSSPVALHAFLKVGENDEMGCTLHEDIIVNCLGEMSLGRAGHRLLI